MSGDLLIALAGDVMTGRGIDQILPAPGSPRLHEKHVRDARSYVELAEQAHGPVPRPVDPTWPWGDALEAMDSAGAAVRVMNLETSVTASDQYAPAKDIHYRMSPGNLACLAAANVDVWSLANNHVLDHGVPGLVETLHSTRSAGLTTAGAGADLAQARAPAVVDGGGTRVAVISVAHGSSGVPPDWRAGPGAPGVALLADLTVETARAVADDAARAAGPHGVRVVSVHWGGNWGYRVPDELRSFAHSLVDAGVDLVHGHSSHHPRPVEVYRGRLVLYGCGDLVNDYEGIGGYEEFRDDLRLLFLAQLDRETGQLRGLTMLPFRSRRLRLERADTHGAAWLAGTLDEACRAFDASVRRGPDGSLRLSLD
jgi:poly-gamma-glutamate capsule biosynthesis protein CapA/YwtB (metallophosphatase superfamily)